MECLARKPPQSNSRWTVCICTTKWGGYPLLIAPSLLAPHTDVATRCTRRLKFCFCHTAFPRLRQIREGYRLQTTDGRLAGLDLMALLTQIAFTVMDYFEENYILIKVRLQV